MKLGQSDPRNRVTTERTDRAVSPVIGVILMVAITVILAAVIGVFVLGLGDELGEAQPTATLSIEEIEQGQFDLVHESGDTIDSDDLSLIIAGDTVDDDGLDFGELSAGETTNVDHSETLGGGEEISIRHDPSDSILVSTDAPDDLGS